MICQVKGDAFQAVSIAQTVSMCVKMSLPYARLHLGAADSSVRLSVCHTDKVSKTAKRVDVLLGVETPGDAIHLIRWGPHILLRG